jgi:UPF0271 protein
MKLDINADLGEGFGPYRMGEDEDLMPLITSANVACGYHAGDPVVMDKTVRLALKHGVDLGAHVGFPDRMGFGRRPMHFELKELQKHVLYQLGALYGIAAAAGHKITHMNFHGALGNMAFTDRALSDALVEAVKAFDAGLSLLVCANTEYEKAAKDAGFRTISMLLADRGYMDNGVIAPRAMEGALIKDPATVGRRVEQLLGDGTLTSISGRTLRMDIDSILVHSDTPGAVALARQIRQSIVASGGVIVPISRGSSPA